MRPLLIILISFVLTACEKPPLSVSDVAPAGAEQYLDAYARDLLKKHKTEFSEFVPSVRTIEMPLSYLTVFKSNNPLMLTRSISNDSDVQYNKDITSKWGKIYCTEALRTLMRERRIILAVAEIAEASGRRHSGVTCVTNTAGEQPPEVNVQTSGNDIFAIADVCRAGLSVLYERDAASMIVTSERGYVRVRYSSPSDSREFSYKCRLENGYILTWDDSLAGARWYGGEPADTKLKYHVAGERLLIQDIINGRVNREQWFATAHAVGESKAEVISSHSIVGRGKLLVLTMKEDSWVEIRRPSGTPMVASVVKAGNTKTFEIGEPVLLVVGNPIGVQATFAGEPLKLPPVPGWTISRVNLK